MNNAPLISSTSPRLYLMFLQTMVLVLYTLHLRPFALSYLSPGLLLLLLGLALVVRTAEAHVRTPGFVGFLALGNLGILLSTVPPDFRNDPSMVCAVMLLLAMVSYMPCIVHFAVLSSVLVMAYGVSLHQADLPQTDAVLSLVSLLSLTLVFLSNNGMFRAEIERLTASTHQSRRASGNDPLTGLPNRAQFLEQVTRIIQYRYINRSFHFAVFFIDLDGFKPINDRFGHQAGDAVLRHTAKLLQGCVRKGDVVARYGGDEFTVLLNSVRGPSDAIRVAQTILAKMHTPINVGESVTVGTSIGIALSTNLHEQAEDLIRDADSAMYRAKAQGKNQYVISDQQDIPKAELKGRWKRIAQLNWLLREG